MTRPELYILGLTAHLWRNRYQLAFLLLLVPLVTAAAVRLMDCPEDLRAGVLK